MTTPNKDQAQTPLKASTPEASGTSAPKLAPIFKPTISQDIKALTIETPKIPIDVRVTDTPTDWVTITFQVLIAIVSSTIAALVVLHQIGKQRKDAHDQHKEATKSVLQLEAYREFQKILNDINSYSMPSVSLLSLRSALSLAPHPTFNAPITYSTPAFQNENNEYIKQAIKLIFFIEQYYTLLPGFDIFKTALSCAIHDARVSFFAVQDFLIRWLPMENPNYTPNHPNSRPFVNIPNITPDALADYDRSTPAYILSVERLQCWTLDFSVELQNHLLGAFSSQPVPRRRPLDARYFTLTIDPADQERLGQFFDQTDWANSARRAQEEAVAT